MARSGRRLAALIALTLAAALSGRGLAADVGPPVAVGARLSQDGTAAKLVFDLSRSVDARAFALASPDRIVVDLPEVNFQIDASVGRRGAARDGLLVKDFRFGTLAAGKSRIVVDLERKACPAEVSAKPIVEGAAAARLTIDLKPCDAEAFAALVRSSPASAANVAAPAPRRRRSLSLIRATAAPTAAPAASAGCRKRRWSMNIAANSSVSSRPPNATAS